MEEETIVINDILSYVSCKLSLNTVDKMCLLKCVESFYPKKEALEALKTLETALPKDLRKRMQVTPSFVGTIINTIQMIPENRMPVFVCKNLNNIPDIESYMENSERDVEDAVIFQEHKIIKSELKELCSSLLELQSQLEVISSLKSADDSDSYQKDFTIFPHKAKIEASARPQVQNGIIKGIKNFKTEPNFEDDESGVDYDEEQRNELLANRYQRALARSVEKGIKEPQLKKYKPLLLEPKTSKLIKKEFKRKESKFTTNMNQPKNENVLESEEEEVRRPSPSEMQCDESYNDFFDPFAVSEDDDDDEDGEGELEDLEGETSGGGKLPSKKSFACKNCNAVFKTMEAFRAHKMEHIEPDFMCPVCNDRFEEKDWVLHVRKCLGEDPKMWENHHCPKCDVFFANKKMLRYHMAYHDETRPFECLECKFRFYTQKAVDIHFKIHSPTPYKRMCPFCRFQTRKLSRMKEHIRSHTGDRPFQCDMCDYRTTTAETLKGHLLTHKQVKDYECQECGKTYKTKCTLRFHQRSHFSDRPHKCPVCGRGFNSGICMTIHYKRHLSGKGRDCSECGYKSVSRIDLRKHWNESHPDIFIYKCSKCEFETKDKKTLIKHKKEHPKTSSIS